MTGAFASATPEGWVETTIGEISDVRLGRQRSPQNHSGDHMRPYLRAANVDWFTIDDRVDVKEMNFTDDEMKSYELRAGDVLVVEGSGSAAEVGKAGLVGGGHTGHAFQNTLIRLRPHDNVDPPWLMYRINAEAVLGGFSELARGVGIFHLSAKRLAAWPIVLPPLAEQRVIVESIERLLSRINAGQADLQGAQSRIKTLQHSYLKWFASASADGAERWSVADIAEVRLGRQRSPKDHSGEQMRPYLRAANVDWFKLELGDIKEMNFGDEEMETYALREGDVLVVEGSGTSREVGKAALVPDGFTGFGFQNTLVRLRPHADIDPRWLMYRINAEASLGKFLELSRGVGIFHLGSMRLAKWVLDVPPLQHQVSLIGQLEQALSQNQRMEQTLAKASEKTSRLARAVLAAAFAGRLTSALPSDGGQQVARSRELTEVAL